MDKPNYKNIDSDFTFLHTATAAERVKQQESASHLLLEKYKIDSDQQGQLKNDTTYQNLKKLLSEKTPILELNPVQEEIYNTDSGTAFVPDRMKKILLSLKSNFVIHPVCLNDLKVVVTYAVENKLKYTIRGAGSWPFGGAIPMNKEIIIDLSYLNFYDLNTETGTVVVGPGVIFAKIRNILRNKGFTLQQDITNANSGSICGWIATGGLGLGSYKYGHVKNAVAALLVLTPDGSWQIVTPDDELFPMLFGSEGQIGIIAGAILKLNRHEYVSKPNAFTFPDIETTQKFLQLIGELRITPTSVLYYDPEYIKTSYEIGRDKLNSQLSKAITSDDETTIRRIRQDLIVIENYTDLEHVVVLEFDSREEFEESLKYQPFSSSEESRRFRDITYRRLAVSLAHKLWDHRFAPVEMKPKGPAMLVSETILPLDNLSAYSKFVQSAITYWTQNPVKMEVHLINSEEILTQTIILADPDVRRHVFYLGLVPFMTQASLNFGGRPYGIGIWNLPFLKGATNNGQAKHFQQLKELKREYDPQALINQCKYINHTGRKLTLRIFNRLSSALLERWVDLLHKGMKSGKKLSLYSIGRYAWLGSKKLLPKIVPPTKRADRNKILEITSACAECDSCERVCPTSDVFGLYGLGTPITRRKTANRLAKGEKISQEEALGFLVCTRCDNCTRVCPTNIPLTDLFDLVEDDPNFNQSLGLSSPEKEDFIERFWQITKDSPLYKEHTLAEHRGEKSHLGHGLKIHYERGFPYAKLFIDPETCIHCGMCADENACTYDAREGRPREIPILIDQNCSLCNACINYCPQNKIIQTEREFLQEMVDHSVDFQEKKYWTEKKSFLRDTTTIQRTGELTDMADIYVTEEILMEIDKEASTGNIPISGMGQGDRHMGIGFDAERFSHFHIVGPAQNRLHEGDPDEELSVILGKRHRYCKFDAEGNMHNPPYQKIKLNTPILYNALPIDSHGRVELAMMKVCEQQNTLMVMDLKRILEHYTFFIQEGKYNELPAVIIPRIDHELIHHLLVNPQTQREFLMDLWRMPLFEITYHPDMQRTIDYINSSVESLNGKKPLLCGYLYVAEYEMIGGIEILPLINNIIDAFVDVGVDVIHIDGLRNEDDYFVTSQAVRSIHHYLVDQGKRHEVALMASGGIRLASDSQKTIQRGAEATLIDFAALLALDPQAYRAINEKQATTEKLINLDIDWAVKRLNNQMESRKVQILEVLGAAGFKDLKKTVGEEGRLIDFYELEARIQKNIFENEKNLIDYDQSNKTIIDDEGDLAARSPQYSELKHRINLLPKPHNFYNLGELNQLVYQRDHVWPGWVIQTLGRMASGDRKMLYLKNVKGTGLLGDGFDVMKILYRHDPDLIPEEELTGINTAILQDKDLLLQAPWMFGGKSVGSIGLDTWKAHVNASRELGTQFDTGEGGYPTCFFLNRKGEPIFLSEPDVQLIKSFFQHDRNYTVKEIKQTLKKNGITGESNPAVYNTLAQYPDLQTFLFYIVVDEKDEPYVSTELKTGLFGVTKETIKKAKRVVIAYSQGAKMGIGGHILAPKVNKLVSYLRGIEGIEYLVSEKIELLAERIEKIEKEPEHLLSKEAQDVYPHLLKAQDQSEIFPELKEKLWDIQQRVYELKEEQKIDPIEGDKILHLCEEVISYSYSSIISPFPFHNCYSIEDVKAFIDIVRMINPNAVVSIKVSPSVDIEFIATGLARIARDNSEQAISEKKRSSAGSMEDMNDYANKYGMKIEIWLDGPRGGTGASPNIIKGQMGMHIEYAIPLIHDRLIKDGLRNYVKFFVSGGIRTYEDVIKSIALGADGVIWGTAPLVAIGCDRNRNCHDGCSRGIATSNLIMQNLRDVEINSKQIINAFIIMQMQVIRALAALGLHDIRELRGRYDKIQWLGLKERVDFRQRQQKEFEKTNQELKKTAHATGQTNCGVAAIIGTDKIPSYILDQTLAAMKNRGMDGVGVGKTMCFPEYPRHYAYRLLIKGILQIEVESNLQSDIKDKIQLHQKAREHVLEYRMLLADKVRKVFLDPYFDFSGSTESDAIKEPYKSKPDGRERDYRDFGDANTDPGDVFCYFIRVKKDVLSQFIENQILSGERYTYIREYFPEINHKNYQSSDKFLQKAEDLFVFDHSVLLTQILYTWDINPEENTSFDSAQEDNQIQNGSEGSSHTINSVESLIHSGDGYLKQLHEYIYTYRQINHKNKYIPRLYKIAAVMSAGKNFAVWKTAGREIPWETPAAQNNIIHVRLATGSIVEQMNAHPFAKLHTALTHNGETTNYETLKQRVEQFGLPPLATTDTEVASLKFHLLAEELEYPDWALFESFSPTTGDDLALISSDLRPYLEEVQRVEFTSSPDGPYQYLCLRHLPENNITERVDLKDPADLRPSTTAFWVDESSKKPRAFSMIASEEQALHRMMELLDKEGLIEGANPDKLLISDGMISRYFYNDSGDIDKVEFIDRYGRPINITNPGIHYSYLHSPLEIPENSDDLKTMAEENQDLLINYITDNLENWNFNTYRWFLEQIALKTTKDRIEDRIMIFTYLIDYLRTFRTGEKAKSSLLDISRKVLYQLFEKLPEIDSHSYHRISFDNIEHKRCENNQTQTILIDCTGFLPEGTDPNLTLSMALSIFYDLGWRNFILYKVNGQRLISTAVMGKNDTDDVKIDVFGTPGEYLGAFMQGGLMRVHGNAQNFAAMCMHHGELQIFGNAGKVCGYASKGGKVFILGDINDRAWTNSVNDSRCQDLQVYILGTASKYAGESLMGGDFIFTGLEFHPDGTPHLQDRPYRGTKLLGGASKGRFLFFDPKNRLDPNQYVHGKIEEITDQDWLYWQKEVREMFTLSGCLIEEKNGMPYIRIDERSIDLSKKNFKLIVAKGGLKGYESH